MQITLEELKELLADSYKQGWSGSLELFEEVATEIAEQFAKKHENSVSKPIVSIYDNYVNWANSTVIVNGVERTDLNPADRSTWTIGVDPAQGNSNAL